MKLEIKTPRFFDTQFSKLIATSISSVPPKSYFGSKWPLKSEEFSIFLKANSWSLPLIIEFEDSWDEDWFFTSLYYFHNSWSWDYHSSKLESFDFSVVILDSPANSHWILIVKDGKVYFDGIDIHTRANSSPQELLLGKFTLVNFEPKSIAYFRDQYRGINEVIAYDVYGKRKVLKINYSPITQIVLDDNYWKFLDRPEIEVTELIMNFKGLFYSTPESRKMNLNIPSFFDVVRVDRFDYVPNLEELEIVGTQNYRFQYVGSVREKEIFPEGKYPYLKLSKKAIEHLIQIESLRFISLRGISFETQEEFDQFIYEIFVNRKNIEFRFEIINANPLDVELKIPEIITAFGRLYESRVTIISSYRPQTKSKISY